MERTHNSHYIFSIYSDIDSRFAPNQLFRPVFKYLTK